MSKAAMSAYEAIRARILSGEFAPGSHLKEEELAVVCGVSRTPIRDALRSLAADMYVSIVPNRGTFVNDWSMGDIEDIFTLRGMMEGYAARRAALRATPEQIQTMRNSCDEIETALAQTPQADIEGFLKANRLLHQTITDAAQSERLSLMLGRLVEQPVVVRTAISYERRDLRRSNDHHHELVSAIEAQDEKWAEAVMVAHIHAAFQAYRQAYQGASAEA
jgi:DNA-binding GntR family transcriptional regulator